MTAFISVSISKAYLRLASATRRVMVDDLFSQRAVRSEIRQTVRDQLPAIGETRIVEELDTCTKALLTHVVQARYSEDTKSHKLHVREEMLKKGGMTQLHFMSPEEVMQRMQRSEADAVDEAVGCCKKEGQN